MADLPLVMTDQGLQPISPADLRAQLVAMITASNPDFTANLPGSLIEDIVSTGTYALVISDSFLVDLVNSITPFGANAFLLSELGLLYGVTPQSPTNTSINVIFSGPPGYVISQGFVVSDGIYQYIIQDGGIIGANGQSLLLFALAPQSGTWPVPANTVTQMVTSVPANITLSVTNPIAGIPATSGEPISVYRERVWTAGLAASTGMARYLKTLVGNVPGVTTRLISAQQLANGYCIIVGGGDPFQVAYAIWEAWPYLPGLVGATIQIIGISNTNPIVITTADNHNLLSGDVETITGVVGLPFVNNLPQTITVIGPKTFTIPMDGTQWGTYVSGGTVTPNPINQIVTITDYPDNYSIPFVIPPQETVNIVVSWATDAPNYVSATAIAQVAGPALMDYVNSLPAGTTPLNLNVMTQIFLESTASILPGELIIDLQFEISINGIGTQPSFGTQVIPGDRNSYFYTDLTQIEITQRT